MADSGNDKNSKIKKIAPYPIPTDILKAEGQPPLKVNIAKLTDFGFLARADMTHFYQVGEKYIASFEIPMSHFAIQCPVKVIKTYDVIAATGASETSKSYTIEMHFLQLSDVQKINIQRFLVRIGQDK